MKTHKRRMLACALGLAALTSSVWGLALSSGSAVAKDATKASTLSGSITVWDLDYKAYPAYTKAANTLDQEFEKAYPHVKVNHVAEPFQGIDPIIRAACTAQQGPDVLGEVGAASGALQFAPCLEPLNSLVTKSMLTRLSGWASTSSSFTPSSTIYGVPNGVLSHVIYYNKKLFAQAGISGPPTDFQSLLADVTKLKAAGIVPFSSGDKEGDENQWWLAVLMSEVGTPADATSLALGKTSYTDSVPLREALSRYITLQDAGAFESDRFSNPLGTSTTMFTQGKAAMYLGLSSIAFDYPAFDSALGTQNVGLFEVPGDRYLPIEIDDSWSIPKFSKNKAAAWAYIKFITTTAAEKTQLDVGQDLPNDAGVPIPANAAPQLKQLIKLGQGPTFVAAHQLIAANVLTYYTTEMNLVLQGQVTLSTLLSGMQSAVGTG